MVWRTPGRTFPDRVEVSYAVLTDKLRGEAELNSQQQWLALNIEAGFPVIDAANSGQFI